MPRLDNLRRLLDKACTLQYLIENDNLAQVLIHTKTTGFKTKKRDSSHDRNLDKLLPTGYIIID